MSEHQITVITTDEERVPRMEISTKRLNRGDKILVSYRHRGDNPLEQVRLGFPEETVCVEIEKGGETVQSPVTELALAPNTTQTVWVCMDAPDGKFSITIIGMRSASPVLVVGDGGD